MVTFFLLENHLKFSLRSWLFALELDILIHHQLPSTPIGQNHRSRESLVEWDEVYPENPNMQHSRPWPNIQYLRVRKEMFVFTYFASEYVNTNSWLEGWHQIMFFGMATLSLMLVFGYPRAYKQRSHDLKLDPHFFGMATSSLVLVFFNPRKCKQEISWLRPKCFSGGRQHHDIISIPGNPNETRGFISTFGIAANFCWTPCLSCDLRSSRVRPFPPSSPSFFFAF